MSRSRLPGAKGLLRTASLLHCVALAALLSACASSERASHEADRQEAANYAAHARGNYVPPGPADDPWGPYVAEAAAKYDVPEKWIREVMRVESGGHLYQNGQLITSWAGAMGLMQVMPGTYDDLRGRYSELGDDPYDPHNNILAGAAYMREMYDIYGSPGFLAAYNAGPRRLDDYLSNTRSLPDETRRYVAKIGPYVIEAYPQNRSQAENYAMNDLPLEIPPGLRYGGRSYAAVERPTYVAARPAARYGWKGGAQSRSYAAKSSRMFPVASAEPIPLHRGIAGKGWAVQVGAYAGAGQAQAAASAAHSRVGAAIGATPVVATVRQGGETLYRSRLTGLSRASASAACEKLTHDRKNCIMVGPKGF